MAEQCENVTPDALKTSIGAQAAKDPCAAYVLMPLSGRRRDAPRSSTAWVSIPSAYMWAA
jgi:hypothetical protein